MSLFTIHYENSIPKSITYRLNNKTVPQSTDDMLLDFLNSFEKSNSLFRPECEDERFRAIYPDVNLKISAPSNYDWKNGSFGNPFDIYVDMGLPLSDSLSELAERFQEDVFKNKVYFNLNENTLMFDQSIRTTTPPLSGLANDEFAHIKELLHFDPTVFSLYKHFLSLKKEFSNALINNITHLNRPFSKWQNLYILSDDFIYRELRNLMHCYCIKNGTLENIFNLTWQNYGIKSDIDSFCIEYISSDTPFDFTFSQAHKYKITKGDLFRACFLENESRISSDYAKKLQSDIDKAYSRFNTTEKKSKAEILQIINDSNSILIDAFYSPEKHGQIKSFSCNKNKIYVDYENYLCLSGTTTVAEYPYPYTMDKIFQTLFGYEYNEKFISPACAMYMAFGGDHDNNPFMYPILHSEFDMYSYVNIMPFHSFSYMIKDLEKIMAIDYQNASFDIETNSFTRILVCLFDTLKTGNSKIKKCKNCGKYFIARNGYEKYCDAPSRGEKDVPKAGDCSYIAKQKQTQERKPEIKELQKLRKNTQFHFIREADFFKSDLGVYTNEFGTQTESLLKKNSKDLNSVTLKLFDELRCGILLCKYDNLRKQLYNDLSNPQNDSLFFLTYSEALLSHNFAANELPNHKNKICYYFKKVDGLPFFFDWENEIIAIINKDIESYVAKAQSRMKDMRIMIINYASWCRREKIQLMGNSEPSNIENTIRFLNNILPVEYSILEDSSNISSSRSTRHHLHK